MLTLNRMFLCFAPMCLAPQHRLTIMPYIMDIVLPLPMPFSTETLYFLFAKDMPQLKKS